MTVPARLKKMNEYICMKNPEGHSRIAKIISIVAGLFLGMAIYSMHLYRFRSVVLLFAVVVLSGLSGFLLIRITAWAMGRVSRVESVRFDLSSAIALVFLLVIYFSFPVSFMNLTFHRGKEIPIAVTLFLVVNLLGFLVVRRKWIALSVLVPCIALVFFFGGSFILKIFIEDLGLQASLSGRFTYPFRDRVTLSMEPHLPKSKKPASFKVHYANHRREGMWMPVNQPIATSINIPDDARLRFEIGVVHPGKHLAPARLLVFIKDGDGKVWNIMEAYVNRQSLGWTRYEPSIPEISPGTGALQMRISSTDEERENLKPLVLSNLSIYSGKDLPKNNVIILLFDALRADALGCYGSKEARTPTIDRLAGKGVLFEKALAPCTWTLPSMTSLITSRLPSQHGMFSYFRSVCDSSISTLSELLSRGGIYTRACIGNWVVYPGLEFDSGFNDTYLLPFSDIIWRNTEALINENVGWLQANQSGPFFLYIHNMDPHSPYFAPQPYRHGSKRIDTFHKMLSYLALGSRVSYVYSIDYSSINALKDSEIEEMRDRYLGEVEYVDSQVSVLEEALRKTGLWDSTLLIITSDHGEDFQEHGNIWHGENLYAQALRIPLIFTGGIMEGRSARITSPVSLMDLYPTILEFYNLPAPEDTIGQSLIPVIERGAGKDRVVFSELVERVNQKFHVMSAVKGEYHFIKKVPLLEDVVEERKLYRWDSDPDEKKDLSAIEPEKAREMEEITDAFFESLPDKKPLNVPLDKQMGEIQNILKALGYMK